MTKLTLFRTGKGELCPAHYCVPLNLLDQLTLFRSGGQIMPNTLLPTPRTQKSIYTSALLLTKPMTCTYFAIYI